MSLTLYILIVMAVLSAGYFLYGRLIARHFQLNEHAETPAVTMNDGVDYVPTKPAYLLSQHFSAIAAAGPIAGPIIACLYFGWGPCILWILLGVIFIGAVHDFSSLIASIRHRAGSIAEIVRDNIGQKGYIAILIFLYLSLIYVIVAFTDITAKTFLGQDPESGVAKGSVASASSMYLGLAVVMGLCQRFLKMPLWLATAIFVPATLFVVWLGTQYPMILDVRDPVKVWGVLILIYCGVASLSPMWALLQPRGYLGGYVLYIAIIVGILGVLFGNFTIRQDAFKSGYYGPLSMPLIPLLFVTIACGACSGFHGLVCSGTTSKQIAREPHTRLIGYGGMLLEGLVAAIALATIMIVAPGQEAPPGGKPAPGTIYGNGIGRFLAALIGEGDHKERLAFASTFGAMAFSTFVFDTLDVCTRLGRYILQELFRWKGRLAMVAATVLMLAVPVGILVSVREENAYMKFWTLFGTSNQLLAGLTLMLVTVWLVRRGKKFWFTFLPMIFMFVMTLWSLLLIMRQAFRHLQDKGWDGSPTVLNGWVALALFGVTVILIIESIRAVRRGPLTGAST